MATLTPAQRRSLRAKAHLLHPVVYIGLHGLTPLVLHEIDTALAAHELIKVRAASSDREEREAFLARICEELSAAPVQHLGKVLIVWREAPERQDEKHESIKQERKASQRRERMPRAKSQQSANARRRRRQI